MSAGMTVTPVLAEEATPEAAAPAEAVAVDAPTFYANSHDVKAVVMNIGAAQDSVNVTWYGLSLIHILIMPWGSRCWILMGATCGCRCTPCAAAGLRL